ncbi:MAG: M23 family metallopeptidase [Actinomycetota bacterium]
MQRLLSARSRTLWAALLVFALLLGETAVAQEDAGEDPPADEEVVDEAAEGDDGETTKKKKKKKKKKKDDEVECETPETEEPPPEPDPDDEDDEDDDEGEGDDEDEPAVEEEEETCKPRCEDDQVDLSPDEEEATCVDQARLNQLLRQFEAAAAEEARALEELSSQLEHLEDLNGQLDALRELLGEVQVRLGAARADAAYARIREEIAAEGLDDVEAALAQEEDELRNQAVQAYMGGDDVELATSAALLELDNYVDLETAREYASAVIDDQLATVDRVDALRAAVETLTEVVAAIRDSAAVRADEVSGIETQVDSLIVTQRELVAAAEAEAEAIAERIAEIQARKQAYAEELRVTGAGGGAIGALLNQRSIELEYEAPEQPFETLAMPLLNTRLGSPFGPRVHPIFTDTRLHTGIDMSGAAGEQILASADGIVVYAEETEGYGNVVVVDHGNTIATLYAHMTADAVWVGLEVVEGDLLGFVGSTGYSTGPHLHYEVRINGQPVDPMPYLKLSG